MTKNIQFPKRKVLKKWVRVSLLIIILIILFLSIFIIKKSLEKEEVEELYNYNISPQVDYRVKLFENSFIDSEYLEENGSYISDLVDKIEVNYLYKFTGSKIIPLELTYEATANIRGLYKTANTEDALEQVWIKEYVLNEKTTKNINNSRYYSFSLPLIIDYSKYDTEVSEFRKQLKMAIDATLNVNLTVSIKGMEAGKVIEHTDTYVLSFPLNQQAFSINTTSNQYSDKILLKEVDNEVDVKLLLSGIFLLIVDILVFIMFYRNIFNLPKKNVYVTKLNKILKENEDIIIELITPINIDNYDLVEVKTFNELINLEEELRIPIMFYELVEYEIGEFYLIHNNILYKYTLYDK